MKKLMAALALIFMADLVMLAVAYKIDSEEEISPANPG